MSYRRGRFGGSRFGGPKPVESGKEYDVQVTEISRKGDGVARVQGFIVFVKGGRVGQANTGQPQLEKSSISHRWN